MSRLWAPNNSRTQQSFEPEAKALLSELGYGDLELSRQKDERKPFEVIVEALGSPPGLEALAAA